MQIGQRVAAAGMVVSGALAVIKIFAGLAGHSTAVVADGLESAERRAGLRVRAVGPDAGGHPAG